MFRASDGLLMKPPSISTAGIVASRRTAKRARLTLELDRHGHLVLTPQAEGVDGALGRILRVVHEAMADGTWHRLKACRQCAWAYYDYSKNRSATWCSMMDKDQ